MMAQSSYVRSSSLTMEMEEKNSFLVERVGTQKKGKILERMITNFKSDYGNLLLSGRRTTELNIPWQMKNITVMRMRK
jgi:hypothetical protein